MPDVKYSRQYQYWLAIASLPFMKKLLKLLFGPRKPLPLPDHLLPVHNAPLPSGPYAVNYDRLQQNFQTQMYENYCAVAAGTIVLNALDQKLTQKSFFNKRTRRVRGPFLSFFEGISLGDFTRMIEEHGFSAKAYHASDITPDEFRELIKSHTSNPDRYLVANYARRVLGQKPTAHFSPLAAYDDITDRVLILDVATYKYPSVWVSVELLYKATLEMDSGGKFTRGIVTIENSEKA
ncbi:MAG: phytochelatin synthase family protein [Methyloligellaceae bacterium]